MLETLVIIAWILGLILGIMWLFLPWIIISKIDEVIAELKRINSANLK